ncbi:hypothetical protein HS1_000183 [Candidatus Desulfofervidus auxilii]|uniref:Uncharacterized protein n=1 Tax=Desulfofervidus auxilii TaxID=1621989 RepID=A0A7U4TG20_DESA2|nr:hypothetical protein [Candidatus Desulfofervidus auxilii]AMM39989.1 hypothetical protein HS1_000183 [Candidatus Desulfofervidus auxilii]
MKEKIEDALKKAIKMEEEGKQFYLEVAKEVKSILVKRYLNN